MKCEKCGAELCFKIYAIHVKTCKREQKKIEIKKKTAESKETDTQTKLTKPQIMEALRENNIKFSTRASRDELEDLLNFKEKIVDIGEAE